MIEHVNIISHEKCLPVSICKIITLKIAKTTSQVYCNSQKHVNGVIAYIW